MGVLERVARLLMSRQMILLPLLLGNTVGMSANVV
ncbi:MAG: hypothetical protein JWO19_139 [Bryobacterales bacterium]|nr:hypothetical protein [Bryobacterales bacterium]